MKPFTTCTKCNKHSHLCGCNISHQHPGSEQCVDDIIITATDMPSLSPQSDLLEEDQGSMTYVFGREMLFMDPDVPDKTQVKVGFLNAGTDVRGWRLVDILKEMLWFNGSLDLIPVNITYTMNDSDKTYSSATVHNLIASSVVPDIGENSIIKIGNQNFGTASSMSLPGSNGGTFTLSKDGSWSFDTNNETAFTGLKKLEELTTTVTYRLHNTHGPSEAEGSISITVVGTNKAPVYAPGLSFNQHSELTKTFDIKSKWSDQNNDTLTFTWVSGENWMSFDATAGILTVNVPNDAHLVNGGNYDFSYNVNDGTDTVPRTETFTANTPSYSVSPVTKTFNAGDASVTYSGASSLTSGITATPAGVSNTFSLHSVAGSTSFPVTIDISDNTGSIVISNANGDYEITPGSGLDSRMASASAVPHTVNYVLRKQLDNGNHHDLINNLTVNIKGTDVAPSRTLSGNAAVTINTPTSGSWNTFGSTVSYTVTASFNRGIISGHQYPTYTPSIGTITKVELKINGVITQTDSSPDNGSNQVFSWTSSVQTYNVANPSATVTAEVIITYSAGGQPTTKNGYPYLSFSPEASGVKTASASVSSSAPLPYFYTANESQFYDNEDKSMGTRTGNSIVATIWSEGGYGSPLAGYILVPQSWGTVTKVEYYDNMLNGYSQLYTTGGYLTDTVSVNVSGTNVLYTKISLLLTDYALQVKLTFTS